MLSVRPDNAIQDLSASPPDPDRQGGRRRHILDCALPLFLAFGFEGVSMSMVARAASGSKGTLYVYFKTKADLFVALMERTWDQLAEPGQGNDALTAADAKAWLTDWVADYLTHINDDTIVTLHRLIIAEAARFPELGARLYAAGPQCGIGKLSDDLAVLNRRGLISCDDTERGAHLLRALAKSGVYERRLWGVTDHVSAEQIREQADLVAATFMSLSRPAMPCATAMSLQ